MKPKKRILVAPLDWGIGHSTRCIPVINALISSHYEVILAADSRPLHLLSTEFPQLEMIRFEGYNIKYSKYDFSNSKTIMEHKKGKYCP